MFTLIPSTGSWHTLFNSLNKFSDDGPKLLNIASAPGSIHREKNREVVEAAAGKDEQVPDGVVIG
jgi:hypothetical protein